MSLHVNSSIICSYTCAHWQRTSDLSERAPQPEASQGPDEVDGHPVHLLQHPHGKRGAAGRQDRAESTKNPAETTGMRYKNVNLVDRKQKRMGSIGCFGQNKNKKR